MEKKKLVFIIIMILTTFITCCGKKADSPDISPAPTVNDESENSLSTPVASAAVTEAVVSKAPVGNTITPVVTSGGISGDATTKPTQSGEPGPMVTVEATQKPEEWKPADEKFILTPAPYIKDCPVGVGNIDTPHGRGTFFDIDDYHYREADERTYSIILQHNFYDSETKEYIYDYEKMCDELSQIDGMEGRPITIYYSSDLFLEVRTEDVLPSYFDYLRYMYSENIISEDVVRIPITIYTYEGCDNFFLYHEYVSNYLMSSSRYGIFPVIKADDFLLENILYLGPGKSYVNYKQGDTIKLVDYAYLGKNYFGEVYKKLYFRAELDGYETIPPEWFLDRGIADYFTDPTPLALTVPYDYFMENIAWKSEGTAYFYYVIKCSEEIEEPGRWAADLAGVIDDYGCGFSPRAFFKRNTE